MASRTWPFPWSCPSMPLPVGAHLPTVREPPRSLPGMGRMGRVTGSHLHPPPPDSRHSGPGLGGVQQPGGLLLQALQVTVCLPLLATRPKTRFCGSVFWPLRSCCDLSHSLGTVLGRKQAEGAGGLCNCPRSLFEAEVTPRAASRQALGPMSTEGGRAREGDHQPLPPAS